MVEIDHWAGDYRGAVRIVGSRDHAIRDRRSLFELQVPAPGRLLRRLAQFDLLDVHAARIGDRQAVFSQPLEVQGNRLPDELLFLRARRTSCEYAGKGRDEGAPSRRRLLVRHGPDAHRASFDRLDWRRMLPSPPGASSRLGLPATVTRPGFVGWRNCRCLPRCTTCRQPSGSSTRITSRTFTGASVEMGCVGDWKRVDTGWHALSHVR